jgi:DNA polymerase III delta prime subunit
MRIDIDGAAEIAADAAGAERLRDALALALVRTLKSARMRAVPIAARVTLAPARAVAGIGRSGDPATAPGPVERESRMLQRHACAEPASPAKPAAGSVLPEEGSAAIGRLSRPGPDVDRLRLPPDVQRSIDHFVARQGVFDTVYSGWNLRSVDPVARLALSFGGPPGSGKTLAAHHVARRLGKPLLEVCYSQIASKYFGESPKNLAAAFDAARQAEAVLFIDEAETLLAQRPGTTAEGADHAIHTLRTELLTLLETTPIVTVFASNLVHTYDPAFRSRLIPVRFPAPDADQLARIWDAHLPAQMPIAEGVHGVMLGPRYPGISGRHVGRIVTEAAFRCAIDRRSVVELADLDWAYELVCGREDPWKVEGAVGT